MWQIVPTRAQWLLLPLGAAALVALAAGGAAWQVQQWRLDAALAACAHQAAEQRVRLESEHAQALQTLRTREHALNTKLQEAQHDHTQRLARLRAAGSSARAELERLRLDLDRPAQGRAASEPGAGLAPAAAADHGTDPARELLGACAAAYLDVAAAADAHAADVQLLLDGWPR